MKGKSSYIIIGLLVCLLLFQFKLISDLDNIDQQQDDIRYDIRMMEEDVREAKNATRDFQAFIDSQKLIQNYNVSIENTKGDFSDAHIHVEVQFNEITNDSNVYYYYRKYTEAKGHRRTLHIPGFELDSKVADSKGEWMSVQLEQEPGGAYTADLSLAFDSNYEAKVVIENGEVTRSQECRNMDLLRKYMPDWDAIISIEEVSSKGNLVYSVNLHDFDKQLDVKEFNIKLYHGDKVIDNFQVAENQYKEIDDELILWQADRQVDFAVDAKEKLEFHITQIDSLNREFTYVFKQIGNF